jgi:hypothetical protein
MQYLARKTIPVGAGTDKVCSVLKNKDLHYNNYWRGYERMSKYSLENTLSRGKAEVEVLSVG